MTGTDSAKRGHSVCAVMNQVPLAGSSRACMNMIALISGKLSPQKAVAPTSKARALERCGCDGADMENAQRKTWIQTGKPNRSWTLRKTIMDTDRGMPRFTCFDFVTIKFTRIFRAGLDKPARPRQKILLHGPENHDAPYRKKGL